MAEAKKKLMKSELIDEVQSTLESKGVVLSKGGIKDVMDSIFEVISDKLMKQGFDSVGTVIGTFKARNIPSQNRSNPKTGEKIVTKPFRKLQFKMSSTLKD